MRWIRTVVVAAAVAGAALVGAGGADARAQRTLVLDEEHPTAGLAGGSLGFGLPTTSTGPEHAVVNPSGCAFLTTCDVIPLDLTTWEPEPPECPGVEACAVAVTPSRLSLALTWSDPVRVNDLDFYVFDSEAPLAEPIAASNVSGCCDEAIHLYFAKTGRYWVVVDNWVGNNAGYTLSAEYHPKTYLVPTSG